MLTLKKFKFIKIYGKLELDCISMYLKVVWGEVKMEIFLHDIYEIEEQEIKLDDELKNGIRRLLKDIVSVFAESEQLHLENLRKFYVPRDYKKELYRFQEDNNLLVGHTQNELAEGYAMVLNYMNEVGERKQAIFIHSTLILGMYSNLIDMDVPKELNQFFCNILLHELCHVSDDFYLHKIIDFESINDLNLLERTLYTETISMWQEYYAYRKSASRFAYGDFQVSHLEEVNSWYLDNVKELKGKFYKDNKMDEFFPSFVIKSRYFIRVIISVIGNIHGAPMECKDRVYLLNIVSKQCLDEKFRNTFFNISEKMESLYIKYPKWQNKSEIEGFNSVLLDLWNSVGVFPQYTESTEMFVGIND